MPVSVVRCAYVGVALVACSGVLQAPAYSAADPQLASVAGEEWTALGWGTNDANVGQPPVTLLDVEQVATAGYSGLALRTDGTVVGWGEAPRVPRNLADVESVSMSSISRLALRADGTVREWTRSGGGHVPSGLSGVTQVSAGLYESAALTDEGEVVAWDEEGVNTLPSEVTDVVAIDEGQTHALALRADGTVVTWPTFVGTGAINPEVPADLDDVVQISAGGYFSAALRADGSVVTWGSLMVPTNISPDSEDPNRAFVQISAGGNHLLALRADGSISGWGNNGNGQLEVPSSVTQVAQIDAWDNTTMATVAASVVTVSRSAETVPERDGETVTFTVGRSGAVAAAGSLDYTTVEATSDHASRKDVTWRRGTLSFGPGDTTKQIEYAVKPDDAPEQAEGFRLQLSPTGVERFRGGNPVVARIGASDQQPDARIRTSSGRLVGAGVFDSSGAGQRASVNVRRGREAELEVRVCNGRSQANAFTLSGSRLAGSVDASYLLGGRDITRRMVSGKGLDVRVRAGDCASVSVRFAAASGASPGARKSVRVRATWAGDVTLRDAVVAAAKVSR